jgi:hypothetical protein
MLSNYFKTAWRNIIRQRSYTLINVIGLGAGIGVCLIIYTLINFHLSFDNFHEKKDRIYRLLTEYHHADSKEIFYGYGVSPAIPWALKTDIPDIKEVVPVFNDDNQQILVLDNNGITNKKFLETSGVFASTPSFFNVFDFPLIAGSKATALKDPNAVILSKETAEKYFGDWKTAMGKTIKWNNKDVLKVTGIFAPIPKNTDFQIKLMISFGTGYTSYLMKSKNWDGTT